VKVVFHPDRCTGCGVCAKVCHNRCIIFVDGIPRANPSLCDRCTQCIAICPQQARSWGPVPSVHYDAGRLPSSEQLDELFKQRRSIRFFKRERIDRDLLEAIVERGVYAPTNNHDLRAVVVDGREVIQELERIVIRFTSRIYRFFFRHRIVFELARRATTAVNPQVRAKLEKRRQVRFNPAAILCIVGDRRIPFSEASAQAALDFVALYAQTKGIGSCLWGAGRIVLDRNKAARRRLGLEGHDRILGVLLLGYPAVRFRNKVEGRTMPAQWVGGHYDQHAPNEEGV
jgi:ferredoxin